MDSGNGVKSDVKDGIVYLARNALKHIVIYNSTALAFFGPSVVSLN